MAPNGSVTIRETTDGSSNHSRARAPGPDSDREEGDLQDLLQALQAMRAGDFSVRMPGDQLGLMGKIADTFNDDRLRQRAHGAAARACRPGGRPRGQDPPARQVCAVERRMGRDGGLGQHADRRSAVADGGGHARHRRRRPGRPVADGAARGRRSAAEGRVPALRQHRQPHDRAAQRVHLGGDARCARSRHRGQARRPGAGAAK